MKNIFLIIVVFISFFECTAQKKPNIIWLMAEDMSLDLECYGMAAVKTPNLNKMANQGVQFNNCFVTNPICSPSRSAMIIGTHQVKINAHHHRSNRNVPLDKKFKPFTSLLRDSGYTCILGHHSVMNLGRKTDFNFKHDPIGEWDGETKFGVFDKFDNFEKEDQPFFAQIQLAASHRGDWWDEVRNESKHPVNPDSVVLPKFMADHPVIRLDWAKYLDQIEYLDNEVGQIFKELEEKGMADNTIVIFIGDNGRCNVRGKGYLQNPGLRIPLLVYSPKGLAGDKIREDVIASTDITATILDFAGVSIPEYMDGRPIFDKKFKREYVYAARDLWDEVEEKCRAVASDEWKYIRNDKPEVPFDAHQAYLEFYRPAVHIMRQLKEEGKLTPEQEIFFASSKPKEELYNLKNDPQELNNLAENPEYAKILKKLRKKTQQFDDINKPVSDIYEPTTAISVAAFEWMKKERPEMYQRMLEGVEVGFHTAVQGYKQSLKKSAETNKKNK